MEKALVASLNQIPGLAKKVAAQLLGGEIFALVGDLGSGKTTFVKAVGKNLKIRHNITSPTFILLQGFEARLPHPAARGNGGQAKLKKNKPIIVYHLDLYRLKNFKEVKALGLTEFWGKPNTVTFIEWADKIKKHLPKKTKYIKFV